MNECTSIECNTIETIDKITLSEQTKFRSCSTKLSKYVAAFDYIDQALIVLSAASGGVSITSFTTIVSAPVGIESASLTLFFSLTKGIVKKLLNITRKKKMTNMIKFLCWLKVNLIALRH